MLKKLFVTLLVAGLFSVACDDSNPVKNIIAHPDGKIYVTNQADQTIYIFDSKTLVRTDSFITPVIEPHFIQFTHDYQYYFVIGRQVSGSIAKYQTSNDSLVALVQVEGAVFPTALAVSANNDTLYLTDFTNDAGHTHRYDITGTNFVWMDSVLQAGRQTHDIRISDDGKYVVSAGFSSDDITVLNTETGDLKPISLFDGENVFNPSSNNYGGYGVLIDHNSAMAMISCRKNVDQIRIVDLNNSTIIDSIVLAGVHSIDPEPIYMAISPDNNILFVANNKDATMSVIRLSTREVIETVEFSTPKAFGISISEDGSRVYVGCTNTRPELGMIYIIDGESYQKLDSITAGSEPFGLIWTP